MHDFNEMLLLLVLLIRGLINLKKKNMKLMNRLFTCKIKEQEEDLSKDACFEQICRQGALSIY